MEQRLTGHLPVVVVRELPDVIKTFQINTPLRLAHFLAQCAHESIGFTATRENLRYSATALRRVFRKYFPTDALAQAYAKQPERIGNLVYANRMGNGAPESGDGFRYRGRGYIQLTGKVNYAAFDKFVPEDIVANPDLVATKYPLLSAAWFWQKAGLNALADQGATDAVVEKVSRRVNGGTNGLDDRLKQFRKYHAILTAV